MNTDCATGCGIAYSPGIFWSNRISTSSTYATGCWARRPLKATASGGRNVLTHYGDCWDNYQVVFTYPGDVRFSFASTQFGDYGAFDAGLKFFGSDGGATVPYSGPIQITGAQAWTWQDASSSGTASGQLRRKRSIL